MNIYRKGATTVVAAVLLSGLGFAFGSTAMQASASNAPVVVIGSVESNGPAAKAGLKSATISGNQSEPTAADIITAIDGLKITDMSGLVSYLANKTQPGQTIQLTVLHDGNEINLPVTLIARPSV